MSPIYIFLVGLFAIVFAGEDIESAERVDRILKVVDSCAEEKQMSPSEKEAFMQKLADSEPGMGIQNASPNEQEAAGCMKRQTMLTNGKVDCVKFSSFYVMTAEACEEEGEKLKEKLENKSDMELGTSN